MRRVKNLLVAVASLATLVGCTPKATKEESAVQKIIKEAQTMTLDQLMDKAIEESNGKTFAAEGNSSRGATALTSFVKKLQTKNKDYTLTEQWSQPKNNTIFQDLDADSKSNPGTKSMTLIQDGNQIESKMVKTGKLDRFIPKEWAEANNTTADKYTGYLSLQTLNKVFMYNCASGSTKQFTNMWDFVAEGNHTLFMDVDSEVVGKNFLYMLSKPEYAKSMKDAYDALPEGAAKTRIKTTADGLKSVANDNKLDANGIYSLAWIKLWVESYKAETDDGPICTALVKNSSVDQSGLLVYSKLRSVEESAESSKNNIKVAAYEDGYKGLGGYGYCHYLFVTDNSPLPWTACAFISYMTTTQEGFEPWGKDMGGYSSNPVVYKANEDLHHHSTAGNKADGTVEFACKNDKGFSWWEPRLVIEDPVYCASQAFGVGSWIDGLKKNK